MLKTVRKIKIIKDMYKLHMDVFEINPPLEGANFLTGGYYSGNSYPMMALFASDEDGNILHDEPIILEEGIPYYRNVFQNLGYTLIEL